MSSELVAEAEEPIILSGDYLVNEPIQTACVLVTERMVVADW
jgi:hypothetical protein